MFMVHESMVHLTVMEPAPEILSSKDLTNKYLAQNMCFSPHWKANVADWLAINFNSISERSRLVYQILSPFSYLKMTMLL